MITTAQVVAWLRAADLPIYRAATRRAPKVPGLAVRKGNGCVIVLDNGAGSDALVTVAELALSKDRHVVNNRWRSIIAPTLADVDGGCILIK